MPDLSDLAIVLLSLTCAVAAWLLGVAARKVARLHAENERLRRERTTTLAEISAVRWLLDIERGVATEPGPEPEGRRTG